MRAYENDFNICIFIAVDNFQRSALFTKEQILTILHTLDIFVWYYGILNSL